MGIVSIPGSLIVELARLAFATPDVDLLCSGESDLPGPDVARDALAHAVDAGEIRYPDVCGRPDLEHTIASYLTGRHTKPVAEARIQVAASGMAAIAIALDALVTQVSAWCCTASSIAQHR